MLQIFIKRFDGLFARTRQYTVEQWNKWWLECLILITVNNERVKKNVMILYKQIKQQFWTYLS